MSSPDYVQQLRALSPRMISAQLFLISVLGLFLELLLIRWVSTEIRIFAYLQNTVLVVCFLGLGMGCWDARRRPFVLRELLYPLVFLVAILAVPTFRIGLGNLSQLLSAAGDFLIWSGAASEGSMVLVNGVMGAFLTFALMYLLWSMFVPVGRLLGGLMDAHPQPIWAYSVNITGSLIGIWLFVALSAAYSPPMVWLGVLAFLALPFIGTGGQARWVDALLLAALVPLGWAAGYNPGWEEVYWSPYQKLSVKDVSQEGIQPPTFWARFGGELTPSQGGAFTSFIAVNNVGYQAMIDLRPESLSRFPDTNDFPMPPEQAGYSQYDLPPKFHPMTGAKALVVGAGSGNDVAGLLRGGAAEIVAVEIDPAIIDLGRRFHREQPYSDSRVRVINDDARSFFATTSEKFDLIVFGLLDSHTTTAMTNARLDHYVYTRESLEHARSLLNPGGVVCLSFEAQKPFIADRMARGLEEVFGHKPLVFRVPGNGYGWGGVMFVTGDPAVIQAGLAKDPKLEALIRQWQAMYPISLPGTTRVPTDDWPYIYLETPKIPILYYLLAVVLIALFFFGLRKLETPHRFRQWGVTDSHFFFLGAAFMLLEVQNISKAAVVLGNTWQVNAVIISGILAMILLANAIAAVFPKLPTSLAYAGILASCLGLYMTDLARFAFLPYATKALVVGLLTSLPMLFSGIVFIRSFTRTERKDQALGANLFGSLVGGLLQSVTFVVGIKALLLLVAGLYLAAMFTRPRALPHGEPATVPNADPVQAGVAVADSPV